jgi:hypothetical protein
MDLKPVFLLGALMALSAASHVSADFCFSNCGEGAVSSCNDIPGNCTLNSDCWVCYCSDSCNGEDYVHYSCAQPSRCSQVP